jgi:hypothetical protein
VRSHGAQQHHGRGETRLAGVRRPSAYARACSTRCGGNAGQGPRSDLDEDLDLDGASSGSTGRRRRSGRDARVAERRAEQLGGAVGDLRLAGEVRRRGHERDHLDHAHDLVEVTDLGLDRGDRVERALLRARGASSGVTPPPTLPVVISSPSRIGSWPAVKTWLPDRTAGT